MKRRSLIIVTTLVVGIAAAAYATRPSWMPLVPPAWLAWLEPGAAAKAQAQGPTGRGRTVAVQVTNAQRKMLPVEVDSIGTVSPIASVALKSRIETTITEVHFEDGARVKAGDLLFVLELPPDRRADRPGRRNAHQGSLAARRRRARLQALQRIDGQGRDDASSTSITRRRAWTRCAAPCRPTSRCWKI